MPHIHTEPGAYDQTASAFIIRTDGIEPTLLLHRHKLLGKYLQFGGHVEPNENPWQALAHELTEESGYDFAQLQVLQPPIPLPTFEGKHTVIHPLPLAIVSHPFDLSHSHFHTDTSWVFTTDQEPLLKPGDTESKEITQFSKDQLTALPTDEIFDNVRLLGIYALEVCASQWRSTPASQFRV